MMLRQWAKSKIVVVGIISLGMNFQVWADSDWQVNKQGVEYQIEGVSAEDQQKAQEALANWQKQTTQFFRTLQALDISYDELIYLQKAYSKIEFGLVYRFDTASSSPLGVPIVAVSPLSFMQALGVKNGDIVQEVNGISLENNLEKNERGQSEAAVKLTEALKSLAENDPITLKVVRKGELVSLNGRVSALSIPELKLVANAPILKEANGSNCALLTIIDYDSPGKSLFKVQLLTIDGNRYRNAASIKLQPGIYQLELREKILDRRLSARIQARYRIKTIELNARPGKLYTLAAELQKDEVMNREKYWKPKVIERDTSCTYD
ncbi:serine protease [Aliikangiella marina]|uniref:Serine protease n=1 Tax=Aliikangiella marina TaxID=1712262 RepID=A0A545T6E0_9GAMM|nr:S1C family serine protease [Aliikangiella marina]TQV72797.1 serine protease [Aliikangiella marina]